MNKSIFFGAAVAALVLIQGCATTSETNTSVLSGSDVIGKAEAASIGDTKVVFIASTKEKKVVKSAVEVTKKTPTAAEKAAAEVEFAVTSRFTGGKAVESYCPKKVASSHWNSSVVCITPN